MSQHDRAIARHYSGPHPERPAAWKPTGDNVSSWIASCIPVRDLARTLSEVNPGVAAREFARGLGRQTRGGRISAACRVVEALEESDPGVAQDIIDNLARIVQPPTVATA